MSRELTVTAVSSARRAVEDLLDAFEPLPDQPLSTDPLSWPDYQGMLERARARTGDEQSVVAGRAHIRGLPCIAAVFNFAFMGGSMGEAEGMRITDAISVAIAERLPLVSVLRTGGARMQEGMRSLVQMQRVARGLVELRQAGLPHVCVARHPTTGGVWASLGAGADVILAEAGAEVAFAGSRVRGAEDGADGAAPYTAEAKHRYGFIDAVLATDALREQLAIVIALLSPATRGRPALPPLPVGHRNGAPQRGWAQVRRARAFTRPRANEYLDAYFDQMVEIHGDRVGGVDDSVRCGFGSRGGATIAFAAQTGGHTRAAGYRTAARLVDLANRLGIPVLTLIDSPGAESGGQAEADGVATAIAALLATIAAATVPILSVTIGEGGSGGSLSLASPTHLWMAADGYFSVTTPESATAILKQPPADVPSVADQLRLAPADLSELGVVRGVLGT